MTFWGWDIHEWRMRTDVYMYFVSGLTLISWSGHRRWWRPESEEQYLYMSGGRQKLLCYLLTLHSVDVWRSNHGREIHLITICSSIRPSQIVGKYRCPVLKQTDAWFYLSCYSVIQQECRQLVYTAADAPLAMHHFQHLNNVEGKGKGLLSIDRLVPS
jgi:hypothetical protein